MSRSFTHDYILGSQSEDKIKGTLEKQFDDTFEKTDRYHKLDFKGEKCWIEVKTRTFNKDKFPTTMLPLSKVRYADTLTNAVYFVFSFTDGLYYIKYDKKVFETFGTNMFKRQDRIDHKDVAQQYCFIPVSSLLRIGETTPLL